MMGMGMRIAEVADGREKGVPGRPSAGEVSPF